MIYCLGAVIILAAVYFILARKADEFIFHPVRGFLAGRLPGETFFLPSGNGKIQALYIPAREGKETLLFFHGNSGNLSHFAPFAQRYGAHGLGVLMFDYRGFGQSTGRVSQRRAVCWAVLPYFAPIRFSVSLPETASEPCPPSGPHAIIFVPYSSR